MYCILREKNVDDLDKLKLIFLPFVSQMSVTIFFFGHLTDTFFTYTFKQWNLIPCTQFVCLKLFGSKIFLDPKSFFDPQFLWTHIFFALKGFFNRNIFGSNTPVDTLKEFSRNLFYPKFLNLECCTSSPA